MRATKDSTEAYEMLTHIAQTADELGFSSLWLIDHLATLPQASQEVAFEAWTSTAALARDTRRIRVGQLVTCNGFRNPALLAKMASTVDVLSHGRLTFGIGAGWTEWEYRAYGYEYPDAPTRLRHLREALQVLLAMWTQEEAAFEGKYYQVHGAINQPKGVQKPHIPLLIGGGGEQVTLKLVAQYGNACNFRGDPATLRRKYEVLKHHCETVGRVYESIQRTMMVPCSLAETDEQAQAQFAELFPFGDSRTREGLIGSPTTVRRQIAELEAAGVQELMLGFFPRSDPEQLRRFAREFLAS
ncbi:LLM class F420-dependent oxidoreductase [Ktedonosporobacter rubrisoli]|uniref:LLM class F420-dependent oxidoreductase n=1 Tax=Ktedonosporobacter rubrisoli TaxID=2509675 RepID=UPI0030F371AF